MSRCRSCDEPIEWAVTTNGKRIPLDLGEYEDGNIILDASGVAHVVVAPALPLRRSHFVSCPNAEQHRRARHPTTRR